LVNGQTRFCHLGIFQEIEWHPDQMALNPIQFLSDILDGLIRVEQVALFDIASRSEIIVVLKGADVVIWISAEEHPIYFSVRCGLFCPCLPQVIVQGIRDKVVLWTLQNLIQTDVRWLRIGVLGGVVVLCWKEA
jgi:hypothetical protein